MVGWRVPSATDLAGARGWPYRAELAAGPGLHRALRDLARER